MAGFDIGMARVPGIAIEYVFFYRALLIPYFLLGNQVWEDEND